MKTLTTARLTLAILVVVCFELTPTLGQAFDPLSSREVGITSYGAAVLTRKPEILRMQLELSAKAKDVDAALKKLAATKQAAQSSLERLGAVPKSINIGTPRIGGAEASRNQMQRMVREQVQGGKKKKASTKASPVSVSLTIKAEWELKGEAPEDLLRQATELQEKIKSADLTGAKDQKEETEEDEEEAEGGNPSMNYFPGSYGGPETPRPGEPSFTFVSRVPDADRATAMKDAFGKAKTKADCLAAAAGEKLGSLRSISSTSAGSDEDNMYSQMRFFTGASRGGKTDPEAAETEAVSPRCGDLTYRIMVTTTFSVDRKAGG